MIRGEYIKWTDKNLSDLKNHYLAGLPAKKIANKFGCSKSAIYQQIYLNGYSRKRNATITLGAPMTYDHQIITMGKQYVTKSGLDATIYNDSGANPYPIHGSVMSKKGAIPCVWNKNGKMDFATDEYDLVEVKSLHIKDIWVNVYKDASGTLHYGLGHSSKEAADAVREDYPDYRRIACVVATMKFMEGDGV